MVMTGSFSSSGTLMIARSVLGSCPTSFAVKVRLSCRVTRIVFTPSTT
jgi:hypothetical protein